MEFTVSSSMKTGSSVLQPEKSCTKLSDLTKFRGSVVNGLLQSCFWSVCVNCGMVVFTQSHISGTAWRVWWLIPLWNCHSQWNLWATQRSTSAQAFSWMKQCRMFASLLLTEIISEGKTDMICHRDVGIHESGLQFSTRIWFVMVKQVLRLLFFSR